MEIFEFGAGNSTLWWAERTASVDSVESDQKWVWQLSHRVPANVDLRFAPLSVDGSYARSAVERGRRFDIVVIDGFDRNSCARRSLPALKEDGVFIWDNSDWRHVYGSGLSYLEAQGFKEIGFSGLGPLNGYGWTTSVLYRPGRNCLDI
jgi:hypothetical protein